MANPQPTDAHLRIAHEISEQLMVSHFTEQQRRILDLVLRLSWGCGKKTATIPHQRDFEIVGVREGHVKSHIDWLTNANVITRDGDIYTFNKDFDKWRVSRAFEYSPKKLTELVRLNLRELTENVNGNLRKREESAYGKRKLSTPDLHSPKEILNKYIKKEYGEFENVLLSDEEYTKLSGRLTDVKTKDLIEQLSTYMKQSPANAKKYKDHYATLLNWSRRDNHKPKVNVGADGWAKGLS